MLRQVPYFAHAAEPSLADLARQAVQRGYGPGEAFFLEGDPAAGLWIVESGRVKAYKLSPEGEALDL
jgi:CRP/FNR family transcriptional regulator